MSDNRKFQNPSQYGTWHEINLEDIEDDEIPCGHILKPLKSRHDSADAEHSSGTIAHEPAATFLEDETLEGLDAVIRNLKQKAATGTGPDREPEADSDADHPDELDEIGKSVLQGMTTDDFLDALEKELEESVHTGDNGEEDQSDET